VGVLPVILAMSLSIAFVVILRFQSGGPDTKELPPITEDEFIHRSPINFLLKQCRRIS
jgi:hypothetical protein